MSLSIYNLRKFLCKSISMVKSFIYPHAQKKHDKYNNMCMKNDLFRTVRFSDIPTAIVSIAAFDSHLDTFVAIF